MAGSHDALRGKVLTVRGPIAPEELGPTLMHEHVLCDITPPSLARQNLPAPEITLENLHALSYGRQVYPLKGRLDLRDVAISEMQYLKRAGGGALVELSCNGLKPDPRGLRDISELTGVKIVMGCGNYVEEYQEQRTFAQSVEQFASEMVTAVYHGFAGTDVRSGMIGEIGCQAPWTGLEKRVMQGAVIAQRETGAAINVHPGRHPDQPQEVADFIRQAGGDMSRVVISHIDRTIFDLDRMLRLADSGVTLEFDLFGTETTYYGLSDIDMPNDGQRIKYIRGLIERGHLARVVISHDICQRTRLIKFGGHGYGHIFVNVLPIMRTRGFSESEIGAIMVDNPRRLLTIV
jgi:phosphotriesterase-related protein